MNKKLLITSFLVFGILIAYQSIGAFYPNKGELSNSQNRGQNIGMENYKEMDIDRESFLIERDKLRSEHREKRIIEREERLNNAVENGCITSEEKEQRMNEWKERFNK